MLNPKKKELKFADVKKPEEVKAPEKEEYGEEEVKKFARVISARIREEDDTIETTIVSNYSLGNVGDTFVE